MAMKRLPDWLRALPGVAAGGLFLCAGAGKLARLDSFADAVAAFGILPAPLAPVAALALPALEILGGVCAMLPWTRRQGLLSLFLLTLVFVAALAVAAAKGLNPECGCFGPPGGAASDARLLLARDAALAAFLGWAYLRELRRGPARAGGGAGAGAP